MAEIDKKTIQKLTELSCIGCTDEEQEALLGDLKKILSHFEKLRQVDTSEVEPCNHVFEGIANAMREDVVGETLSRDLFLSNVPSHKGGFVLVPTVIKQTSP